MRSSCYFLTSLCYFFIGATHLAASALAPKNNQHPLISEKADSLVILSPHSKSVQIEFVSLFKEYYKAKYNTVVNVDWLEQGGTSDDVRFLRAKFAKNQKSSQIDIFWGGGTNTFLEIARDQLLEKFLLPDPLYKQIPITVGGIPLYDGSMTWYGSALSSFGIFYNKVLLKIEKKPEPTTWQDLGKPVYINNLMQADPRKSGTFSTMNHIIIQSMGWTKGWDLLTRMAGNTRQFAQSSSIPIKAVVAGNVAIALAIDFYAKPKVDQFGTKNLEFVLPSGQTVLDADPIAILRGAPHLITAQRFVEFVLSSQAQKLLILPQGKTDGPKFSTLGRMAVNTLSYRETEGERTDTFNPFAQSHFLKLDSEKASRLSHIMNDLVGALLIDCHSDLKAAWRSLVKMDASQEKLDQFAKMPLSEQDLETLAEKWDNEVLRNRTINIWVEFAQKKYKIIRAGDRRFVFK